MSKRSTLRSPAAALGTAGVLLALLAMSTTSPGYPDDRDLLRFSSSKPYLFIELDTSASMNLAVGGGDVALYGGADNPNSRLYAAKQALFNIFKDADDVFFGFSSYNQDHVRVTSKHWVYYVAEAVDSGTGTWPIVYPQTDADALTQIVDNLPTPVTDNVPETVVNDIEGDVLTLGPIFDIKGSPGIDAADLEGGSCDSPLPLGAVGSRARITLDTFSLLDSGAAGVASPYTMTLWISTISPARKYRVLVDRPATRPAGMPGEGTPNAAFGAVDPNGMVVSFTIQEVTGAACTPTATTYPTRHAVLKLDSRFKQTVLVDGHPGGGSGQGNAPLEAIPDLWPAWSDAVISGACESGKPFSGKGWEGNYDSNDLEPGLTITDDDRFCTDYTDSSTCVEIKPVTHTTYSTVGSALSPPEPTWDRPLDRGDMLPFDWANSQRDDMLKRFAPNYGTDSPPDFGVGSLLADVTTAGSYPARVANQPPLIAGGNSPLGKSILDFRCWYLGTDGAGGANKCREAATSAVGWHTVGCELDPSYGCRKPYLIVISDGDDNCPGENPAADTAAMHSFSGIRTWALNVGDPRNCQASSPLKSITTNGKGECINVSTPDELLKAIQEILGLIREEARSFASAAVPSVQAVADQAVYLTNFTPLNNNSRWPGHLNSFLKALPLTEDRKPDFSKTCPPRTDSCFVWDAGKVLATQPTRHVFYARQSKQGMWVPERRELLPTTPATPQPIRYDLWRAFGLITATTQDGDLTPAEELAYETEANAVIATTLAMKTRVSIPPCDPTKDLCEYKLGDIFHSDPLVAGQPSNVEYFKNDLGREFNQPNATCTAINEGSASFDRGYRCFFRRHERRRQSIFIGSNDGMLHAFNAAQFQTDTKRYDNGTGNELFAYMPRPVMPTVKQLASSAQHQFTVDGSLAAADVFIDPVFTGNAPVAGDRRWRTVAVGGLREGGRGYYALDITQPDGLTLAGGAYTPDYESGTDAVPACLANYNSTKCGETPYGAPIWEFTDNTDNQIFDNPVAQPLLPLTMDEDGNGLPDLGWTWSTADFARIQICESSTPASDCRITRLPGTSSGLKQHFVAIFGGGMDAAHKNYDPRNPSYSTSRSGAETVKLQGHWLYMVDVETGQLLYKRQLCSPYITNALNATNPCVPGGSAPSKVAAVDSDLNGFVDRIYVGTIGGFLYRVNLEKLTSGPDGPEVKVPSLTAVTVNAIGASGNPTAFTVKRIPETDGAGEPIWNPRVIFDANWEGNTPSAVPRPIFYRPAVVINQHATVPGYAVAFGTGDREDLWSSNRQEGRFYLFMDDTDVANAAVPAHTCATLAPGADCPRTENDYRLIDVSVLDSPVLNTNINLLNGVDVDGSPRPIGRRGWFMPLGANEKVITDAFSFVGVTFFSSFVPQVSVTSSNGTPLTAACGDKQYESNTTATCAKVGTSNQFLVSATNGNPLLIDPDSPDPANPDRLRSQQVSTFVTNPFTEFSGGGVTSGTTGTSDFQTTTDVAVMELIKGLFPSTCRFVNAHIDIKTVAADTTVQKLASIPVCLSGHSWKEF